MTRARGARPMRAVAVVDLGFGDAGKGLVTDYLVRTTGARMVVRFNGGAQAGHNVVTADGRHHTFSQLGSGTFVPGVRTHLARRVVVHPTALLVEARRLIEVGVPDALERVSVSPEALVTTPFHQAAGRLRELARGAKRHGSCGVGVGEVMRDSLENPGDAVRVEHLADGASLRPRLKRVQERVRASVAASRDAARRLAGEAALGELRALDDGAIVEAWIDAIHRFVATVRVVPDAALRQSPEQALVFEGAQGVLLDESHGFHPFTTWSRCTFDHAEELWRELRRDEPLVRLGVVRAYIHRHGPGPLPTESPELADALVERHNGDHPWQGRFRVGWPDLVLARYARDACRGLDGVAVTHLDAVARLPRWRAAVAYDGGRTTDWPTAPPEDLETRAAHSRALARVEPQYVDVVDASPGARVRVIEEALSSAYRAPVLLYSYGPTAADVRIDPV